MNKKLKTILIAVLLVAVGAGAGAYAASTYGTQSDPLVAKSYLDNTLTPKLQSEFQTKVDQQSQVLENEIASANKTMNFAAVSLSKGQTLRCSAGCEVVLRSGQRRRLRRALRRDRGDRGLLRRRADGKPPQCRPRQRRPHSDRCRDPPRPRRLYRWLKYEAAKGGLVFYAFYICAGNFCLICWICC